MTGKGLLARMTMENTKQALNTQARKMRVVR